MLFRSTAARYNIPLENLKGQVAEYASMGGLIKPAQRPLSGIQQKKDPEDAVRKNQRLLLTWLTDEPRLFSRVRQWVTPEDFSDDLYRSVAKELFAGMESGSFSPAAVLDRFEDEEEHRQVAEMFNTNLVDIETPEQRKKAFHDIIYGVRQAGYERLKKTLKPDDPEYLMKTIQGKKELEKLAHTPISPDD